FEPPFLNRLQRAVNRKVQVRVPVPEPTSCASSGPRRQTSSVPTRQTFGWFVTATSVPARHSAAVRELSVTEQRYEALQGVLAYGRTASEVALDWDVSRQTVHEWLGRNEDEGFEALNALRVDQQSRKAGL